MFIQAFTPKENFPADFKLKKLQVQFKDFIEELNSKNLPQRTVVLINEQIERLNNTFLTQQTFKGLLIKKQAHIVKIIRERHNFVPINYYRKLYTRLAMVAIGLPLGTVVSLSSGNIGLLPIGLPLGMMLGLILGSKLDKKALKENRVLLNIAK